MSDTRADLEPMDPASARALLEHAPSALISLSAHGTFLWANAAARALVGDDEGSSTTLRAWLAEPATRAAISQAQAQAAAVELELPAATRGARWVRVEARALPGGGWVLGVEGVDALREARAAAEMRQDALDLARSFGRLAFWQRDLRSSEGEWDDQMRKIWGIGPSDAIPSLEQALDFIVPADQVRMRNQFLESTRQAGKYSSRFRIRGADGVLRWLQSQWMVKNGPDGKPEQVIGLMMNDTEPYALASSTSEAESQLMLAVDLAGLAVWRHDFATHRVHFNNHAYTIFGLTPRTDGLSLDEVRALVHPDDLPAVLASAPRLLDQTQPIDLEVRYLRTDHTWRRVQTRRVAQRDDQGRAIASVGVGLDTTEQVQHAQKSESLSRRFELVAQGAGIGYWTLESAREGQPQWSPQLRQIFGLAPNEPVPSMREWFRRFVHPDDRARVKASTNDWVFGLAQQLEINYRIVRADGKVRQIFSHARRDSEGEDGAALGVIIDITEQRQAELALGQAQERVALVTRAAGLGTWELDLVSGTAVWDDQMWALRGRAPRPHPPSHEERISWLHPDDREATDRRFRQAWAQGRSLDMEFRVIWPDGQVRWLASRSTDMSTGQGGARRRIGVNWDITDSRTAAQARLASQLAQSQNQAKSMFLARMSHELRTPLNAVLGFAQLLIDREPGLGTEPASLARLRHLHHIRDAGLHLLSLINDVLDLASVEGGEVRIELKPVALAPLLAETLPLLEPMAKRHGVALHVEPTDLAVFADATRLRQVLLNLLSNAIKYNRAQGQARVQIQAKGERVQLRVIDTGRGMTDEQLTHLFEPFNRLGVEHGTVEGSGIGLCIVKALTERMGGSVRARSSLGKGSSFDLEFDLAGPHAAEPTALPTLTTQASPAQPQATRTSETVPATTAPPAERKAQLRRVLYVEDNAVNALIVSELLARRSDVTLHIAVNAAEGLTLAHELQPALVLLDMQLPDADGYEVLRRLRANPATAAIPCVALSANAMPADIERALQAGMAEYWTKPLDFKVFTAAFDRLLERVVDSGPSD